MYDLLLIIHIFDDFIVIIIDRKILNGYDFKMIDKNKNEKNIKFWDKNYYITCQWSVNNNFL